MSSVTTAAPIPEQTALALAALHDDAEIIEAVTLNLYPDWTPGATPDPQLATGARMWRQIVARLATTKDAIE